MFSSDARCIKKGKLQDKDLITCYTHSMCVFVCMHACVCVCMCVCVHM